MNKRYILSAITLLILAALACNRTVPTPSAPSTTGTAVVGDGATAPPGAEETPPPAGTTATPVGSATPSVPATPATGTPGCVYDAEFVADITIPDDTKLVPGTEFVKTWRMRNSGTCAWTPGTAWTFIGGEQMGGPDSVAVLATQPGDTTDITVNLAAPAIPDTYIGRWQMHRADGESFGTPAYVRIMVAEADVTLTPTATATTPTPTATAATAEPGAGPTIEHFRSNVSESDPGDTVTLEWKTKDATSAVLYHLMSSGQLGSFWEVEPQGVFEYEIGSNERNRTDFMLIVSDAHGRTAQASVSITLRCPDTWFFSPAPEQCPAAPAVTSAGAEEHFERGTMVWVASQGLIYVLFDDGQSPHWATYRDEWDAGDPETDPSLTPPPDLYQPARGFGLVWREQPGVRERLGWAKDPEAAFNTAVQYTSRPRYNDTYIRALDGGVWKLLPEFSGWDKLPPP